MQSGDYHVKAFQSWLAVGPKLLGRFFHGLQVLRFRFIRNAAGPIHQKTAPFSHSPNEPFAVFSHFLRRAHDEERGRHIPPDTDRIPEDFFGL